MGGHLRGSPRRARGRPLHGLRVEVRLQMLQLLERSVLHAHDPVLRNLHRRRVGLEFAHIAFCHIWMVTPCFKVLELNCGCCQKLYGMCVHCCLDPWMEAFALCCSAFKKS